MKNTINKLILGGTYFFKHEVNRMKNEGDIISARKNFFKFKFNNLNFLLKKRFNWMNKYLRNKNKIYELGSGAGFSRLYINKPYIMTDVIDSEWIDLKLDALNLNLANNSCDAIITSHCIHHFAKPVVFFRECERVLKPGGLILIQEINTSLMTRFFLRLMKHEGWSYDVDVFDETKAVNHKDDPWSANCAVPELLFNNLNTFHETFKSLEVIYDVKNEGFILPLSGGVISKIKMIELPTWFLEIVNIIDRFLISFAPNIFAMGRSIIVKKRQKF